MKELKIIEECINLIESIEDAKARSRILFYLNQKFQFEDETQIDSISIWNVDNKTELIESNNKFPQIKDLIILDYVKNEPEWILVYWYYVWDFWNKTFTKEDIFKIYDSSWRKTKQRIKNFSQNFNSSIKKWYIKGVNETDFILTKKWSELANNIIFNQKK